MSKYLFRKGDGNEGNFPRFVVMSWASELPLRCAQGAGRERVYRGAQRASAHRPQHRGGRRGRVWHSCDRA
jgi:hypothetical protein